MNDYPHLAALQERFNNLTRAADRAKHRAGRFPFGSAGWELAQAEARTHYAERAGVIAGYLLALGCDSEDEYEALAETLYDGWIAECECICLEVRVGL